MARLTAHFYDAEGRPKRIDMEGHRFDVYVTRELAESLGRQITETPGGPHSSPVLDDGPGVASAAVPLAATATTAMAATGGAMAQTEEGSPQCIMVNGVVICTQ
ncbi:MAG: hypothetical protein IRZ00_16585 [Gemmatimonadetes bacterium]|nr:hypothetical protein [Gemmatimonadota bacterium]